MAAVVGSVGGSSLGIGRFAEDGLQTQAMETEDAWSDRGRVLCFD
jgi:hypothetical protein